MNALFLRRFVMWSGLAAIAATLPTQIAFAQNDAPTSTSHRTSSLSWIRMPGAESCVPTQELARDVEVRLARTVFVSASQADVSIEGRIEHRSGKWHAIIILRDGKGATLGTRELEKADASCEGMREQLALVIAVMIDPDAALSRPAPIVTPATTGTGAAPTTTSTPTATVAPTTTETSSATAAPTSSSTSAPTSTSPSKSPPSWNFEASGAAMGAAGLTPNPAFGLGVSSLLEAPQIPIALTGVAGVFLDSTATANSTDGRTATTTFNLIYIGGGLCPLRYRSDRFHFFGCLVSQLGILRARNEGFSTNVGDKIAGLYDFGGEARFTLRIAGPFVMRGGVSGVFPLVRFPFTYDRGDGTRVTLFQVSPVAATGDLGLGFEFP